MNPEASGLQTPAQSPSARAGAPAPRYFVDAERYRFPVPDVSNPAFYPVPSGPVDRKAYLRTIEALDLDALARRTDHGMHTPKAALPLLVRWMHRRNPRDRDAVVRHLQGFHAAMLALVKERGWFWQFEDPAALIPVYRKCLIETGVLRPDTAWFRELVLCYARNLHVWDSKPIEWRGACHRSMPEGMIKALAAKWYPDIPERERWQRYGGLVLRDFLRAKELPQNDTGYQMGPLLILACTGDQWAEGNQVWADPAIRRLWDRLWVEVTPDGAVSPYGPNGGWNSTADHRIAFLERAAARTGDGRLRWVAHRLFHHLRWQSSGWMPGSWKVDDGSTWLICLAWLFADDRVAPVEPEARSVATVRGEAIRVPHTDKALTERLIGDADPDPDKGHLCCSWHLTNTVWPDKLVLRGGWKPGDLFALVELHPTSFPANPGGIMGLSRWGAPFTQIVTSKGASVENRLQVEDIGGTARRRLHPDKRRIDEFWHAGTMPDIRSEMLALEETPEATYARMRIHHPDGLPVRVEREFLMVRNRFLASREVLEFLEPFEARVAALWNTQNIGPQIGAHWANTFLSHPVGDNGGTSRPTPPVDLLVWFAPHPDRTLRTIDRTVDDPRAEACPNQVRHEWSGRGVPGSPLVFTQAYVPHPPHRPRPVSNNPNPGGKAAYADVLEATAGAAGISVERDDPDTTIVHFDLVPGIRESVLFNPGRAAVSFADRRTDQAWGFVRAPRTR